MDEGHAKQILEAVNTIQAQLHILEHAASIAWSTHGGQHWYTGTANRHEVKNSFNLASLTKLTGHLEDHIDDDAPVSAMRAPAQVQHNAVQWGYPPTGWLTEAVNGSATCAGTIGPNTLVVQPETIDLDIEPSIVLANTDHGREMFQENMDNWFDFEAAALEDITLPNYGPSVTQGLDFNSTQVVSAGSPGVPVRMESRERGSGPIRRNFHCPHCMKSYSRRSDRDRHALSHNPNALRYSCPAVGCNRIGMDGFLRKDKLAQHRSHMGH